MRAGADILRVHDVREMGQAMVISEAVLAARSD
jgi:dihydropteroate synthase